MGALALSYCTFGLTDLGILDAIDAVGRAGYRGIEISFHRSQLNPFDIDDDALTAIGKRLQAAHLEPACVATASHFFTPSRPHEPSLMSLDLAGRKRRIDLIKRGIHVARRLGAPLVTFGSGFLREEHVSHPSQDPRLLLLESIEECLREIRDDEDITLLIEPEPGMLIETLDQGLALIAQIDSPHFKLHVDICHAYCSERNYIGALAAAAPHTRYLHVSDARRGYNLRIEKDAEELTFDLDVAAKLVYFPDTADYLLVDRDHPLYFCDAKPQPPRRRRIEALLARAGVHKDPRCIDYPSLYAGASPLDDEIFTYLISVPGLSYEVLERARPVIAHLRGVRNPPLIGRMVANTLTGVAHFHEIPGEGTLDFAASFDALTTNGFSGYASVELYHHVESWQEALDESHRHLAPFTDAPCQATRMRPPPATTDSPGPAMIDVAALGWDPKTLGELDHRLLRAPSIKLRSAHPGRNGDVVYCVDLRIRRPNAGQELSATELHSIEHFLLEGLKRELPENFVSVGVMGCQTGFYLTLLNEGRAWTIRRVLEDILSGIRSSLAVPYARIDQCGNYRNHSLELAQEVAREVLESRATWMAAV